MAHKFADAKKHILPTLDIRPRGWAESSRPVNPDHVKQITSTEGTIFEAVASLIITFIGKGKKITYSGTGFVARHGGKFWLLTAAHNVVEKSVLGLNKAHLVEIHPGRYGYENLPFSSISVAGEEFEVPEEFERAMDAHDIARLNLEEYKHRLTPHHFLLASPKQINEMRRHKVIITGYPEHPRDPAYHRPGVPGFPAFSMWMSAGEDTRTTFHHICYREWTAKGNSGSPVYFQASNGQFYAAGVHVGYDDVNKANMAVMVTSIFSAEATAGAGLHAASQTETPAPLVLSRAPDVRTVDDAAKGMSDMSLKPGPPYRGSVISTLTSCQLPNTILTDISCLPDGRLLV